jgi:hypothetical protein
MRLEYPSSLAPAFNPIDAVFSVIATGPSIEQQGRNLVEIKVDAKV